MFSYQDLAPIVAPYLGRAIITEELLDLRDALTARYFEAGYVNSGALIPDQEVRDGVIGIQIVEGRLKGDAVQAQLRGQVLLVDRTLQVTAGIAALDAPAGQSPALAFDVTGDWDNVAVTPQVRSLIERSGAAKPLFPSQRVPTGEQRPQATAQ